MSNRGHPRRPRIRTQARAFAIWREGKAVNWKCTVRELAEATRLPVPTVAYIVSIKRWPVLPEERQRRADAESSRNLVALIRPDLHDAGGDDEAPGSVVAYLKRAIEEVHEDDEAELLTLAD